MIEIKQTFLVFNDLYEKIFDVLEEAEVIEENIEYYEEVKKIVDEAWDLADSLTLSLNKTKCQFNVFENEQIAKKEIERLEEELAELKEKDGL